MIDDDCTEGPKSFIDDAVGILADDCIDVAIGRLVDVDCNGCCDNDGDGCDDDEDCWEEEDDDEALVVGRVGLVGASIGGVAVG